MTVNHTSTTLVQDTLLKQETEKKSKTAKSITFHSSTRDIERNGKFQMPASITPERVKEIAEAVDSIHGADDGQNGLQKQTTTSESEQKAQHETSIPSSKLGTNVTVTPSSTEKSSRIDEGELRKRNRVISMFLLS